MQSRKSVAVALLALAMAGCREPDGPGNLSANGRLRVDSDPRGGMIWLDDKNTGRLTPDSLPGLTGRHTIRVQQDSAGTLYSYVAQLNLTPADSMANLFGPLLSRCSNVANLSTCYRQIYTYHTAANLTFATNSLGATFLYDASGSGLLYPKNTQNSYASSGSPVFAATVSDQDTLSLGIYDEPYLAGRPAPAESEPDGGFAWQVASWIVPPFDLLRVPTIRGLRIDQQLLAIPSLDGTVALRMVFHNITADSLYQTVDPIVPSSGLTFENAYIGYALDPDIGLSGDDLLSYEPDLDLVYAYDSQFDEGGFSGGWNKRPALVGLRVLEAPAGAHVVINGYANQSAAVLDWHAGQFSEPIGWGMLSGTRVYTPDDPDPKVGHLPPQAGDVRIMISAGPLRLAPGDSAAITVAIIVAPPTDDTFVSGIAVDPGDPFDPARQIHRVASGLIEAARAADALRPLVAAMPRPGKYQ